MLDRLNADLARETEDIAETEKAAQNLTAVLEDLQAELKATKRQRVRDIMKHPEQEALLEETYDEMESDLSRRIEGIRNQIDMSADKRNTIIRVNRAAKTALEVFDDILQKPKLERQDLTLIIERITVFEDHIEVQLKADIDSILKSGTLPEETEDAANFDPGMADSSPVTIVQCSEKHADKVYHVNVISNGDPLEIFTDKDGELIFKKYSPIGELGDFAAQICDSLRKTTDGIAAVCDRDTVIAIAGGAKKELLEKPVSAQLGEIMAGRSVYRHSTGGSSTPVSTADEKYCISVAAPVAFCKYNKVTA